MAVAGGACSAYRLSMKDGQLMTKATSYMRSECHTPAQAIGLLAQGKEAIVAGSDMAAIGAAVRKEGIDKNAQK